MPCMCMHDSTDLRTAVNITKELAVSYQNFQYIAAQIQLFQFNQEGKRARR